MRLSLLVCALLATASAPLLAAPSAPTTSAPPTPTTASSGFLTAPASIDLGLNQAQCFAPSTTTVPASFQPSPIAVTVRVRHGRTTVLDTDLSFVPNGEVTPAEVSERTPYIQSYGTTLAANRSSTTQVVVGQVVSGFSSRLRALPVDHDANTIVLAYEFDLAALQSLDKVASDKDPSVIVQRPTLHETVLCGAARLSRGETLTLTGLTEATTHHGFWYRLAHLGRATAPTTTTIDVSWTPLTTAAPAVAATTVPAVPALAQAAR